LLPIIDYYYSSDRDLKYLHLVSEYYPATLHTLIKNKLVTKDSVPEMMYQVLKGLEYMHGKGVVHGDLAAENVMLRSSTKIRSEVVLGGYGNARYEH
jgi:serine/threonine protein kinase